MSPDDRLLFDRWTGRRDAEAFNEMARRYAGLVYHTCVRVLRNHADAQDVAQECFETLAGLRKAPTASLGAYLHAMAFNKALNRIKSERRRSERESRYVQSQPPRDATTWDDVYGEVDGAIAALPANLREPIIAHFLEGLTHEAIAQREGVSRPAVTQRIQRGVERIRETLRRKGITVGTAALTSMLAGSGSAAAAAGLEASIGKLAIAGTAAKGGAWTLAWAAAGLAACAALGGGAVLLMRGGAEAPAVSSASAPASGRAPVMEADPPEAPASMAPSASVAPVPPAAAAYADASSDFATVVGRVIDEAGTPAGGVQVTLWGPLGSGVYGSAVSGEDGSYAIYGVAPSPEVRIHGRRDGPTLRSEQAVIRDVKAGETYACDLRILDLRAEGRVVDRSGRDLSAARILAHPAAPYDGGLPVSDIGADGRFALAGLVPGEWEWQVQFPGEEWRPTGRKLTVRAGRSLEAIVVEIGPAEGVWLAGTVHDADGKPLAGAYVRAHTTAPPHDSQSAVTGADGRFLLEGLTGSRYFLQAAHADYGSAFKQDTPAPSEDIALFLPRRGALEARIIDAATGEAVSVFEVFESKPAGNENPTSMTSGWERIESPAGEYAAANLLPQTFELRVRAEGYATYEARFDIPAGETVAGVVVALERERILRGQAVDALGAAVAGVQFFEGSIPAEFEMDRRRRGRSGGDGRFEIVGLPQGPAVLAAYHHDFAPVWIDAAPGVEEVTVRLAAGAAVRAAVSVSGAEAADIYVSGRYTERGSSTGTAQRPGPDGGVTLERLTPGTEVVVLAAAKFSNPALGDRKQYIPLRLRDGEKRDLQFHFAVEGGRLEATVTADGAPAPGLFCWVVYTYPEGATESIDGHTDARGLFAVEGLPEGPCRLVVMPPGVSDPAEGIARDLVIGSGTIAVAVDF